MSNTQRIRETLERYIERLNQGDVEGILELYAENPVLEDPVGQPPHEGFEAVRRFYQNGIGQMSVRAELQGPIRITDTGQAAIAFTVTLLDGSGTTIDVIDVMTFDQEAQISSMQAYWGTGNLNTPS